MTSALDISAIQARVAAVKSKLDALRAENCLQNERNAETIRSRCPVRDPITDEAHPDHLRMMYYVGKSGYYFKRAPYEVTDVRRRRADGIMQREEYRLFLDNPLPKNWLSYDDELLQRPRNVTFEKKKVVVTSYANRKYELQRESDEDYATPFSNMTSTCIACEDLLPAPALKHDVDGAICDVCFTSQFPNMYRPPSCVSSSASTSRTDMSTLSVPSLNSAVSSARSSMVIADPTWPPTAFISTDAQAEDPSTKLTAQSRTKKRVSFLLDEPREEHDAEPYEEDVFYDAMDDNAWDLWQVTSQEEMRLALSNC